MQTPWSNQLEHNKESHHWWCEAYHALPDNDGTPANPVAAVPDICLCEKRRVIYRWPMAWVSVYSSGGTVGRQLYNPINNRAKVHPSFSYLFRFLNSTWDQTGRCLGWPSYDPLTPKPQALSQTGESRCWHSCIIHHSTNNPRLHQEGWEQFDWIDKKRVGGRRRIRQWKYAFDSFHSLRGLWFTVIHIVSNLIWNNPGQGGESADREHETVLASLKRQQRCLEGGERRFQKLQTSGYQVNKTQKTWQGHTFTQTGISPCKHINKRTQTLQVINWSEAFSSVCGVCTVPSLWQLVFVTETLLIACRGHMTMDIKQRKEKT